MRVLFVGDLEFTRIVPAPSKVGYELFKRVSSKYQDVRFYTYFQDGTKYSRSQKFFGKQKITNKITQMGLLIFLFNIIRFRPQIVQIITPSAYYLLAFPIFKLIKAKIYYLVHNVNSFTLDRFTFIGKYHKKRILWIEKMTVLSSTNILVLSKREKQHMMDAYRIISKKIIIVDNGINIFNCKRNYLKDSKIIKVITVGSLDRKEKGTDSLIDFLGKLNFPIELTICYHQEHMNKTYNIPSNVNISWSVPLDEIGLRKEFTKNDFFISFAAYEPFNIALLEAMNTGLLFLATDRIGLTERFNKKLQKCIIAFGQWEFAKDKLNYLINLSQAEKQVLSIEIMKFSNQFTWDKVIEKYFELYENVNQ